MVTRKNPEDTFKPHETVSEPCSKGYPTGASAVLFNQFNSACPESERDIIQVIFGQPLNVLQAHDNAVDAVPCEKIPILEITSFNI